LQAIALLGADSFSNPTLVNNIIWHNRSYYNDASLNGGAGGLAANPAGLYQDLGVVNTVAAQSMNPLDCILTSTAGYDTSNQATDPLFVTEYTNTLTSANVLDEGGNSINVTYPELTASLGNYHIDTGSPAINAGRGNNTSTYPQLAADFDSEPRPMGGAVDIGADEYPGYLTVATQIGTYRSGAWYLDSNGNGVWNGGAVDTFVANFGGNPADRPVTGDWDANGITEIGIYRNGAWYLDTNGNGVWNGGAVDTFVPNFGGNPADRPVTGTW
jgi:hypothetical protein